MKEKRIQNISIIWRSGTLIVKLESNLQSANGKKFSTAEDVEILGEGKKLL